MMYNSASPSAHRPNAGAAFASERVWVERNNKNDVQHSNGQRPPGYLQALWVTVSCQTWHAARLTQGRQDLRTIAEAR